MTLSLSTRSARRASRDSRDVHRMREGRRDQSRARPMRYTSTILRRSLTRIYEETGLDLRSSRGGQTFPLRSQRAYYVLADVSSLPGQNSKEKAMFLLEETGVASVPGEAFFPNGGGKDLVRFCFAKTEQELQEACCRLEQLSSKPRLSIASPLSQ